MSGISSSSSAFLPALKYERIEFIPSVFPISNVSIDGMSSSSSCFDAIHYQQNNREFSLYKRECAKHWNKAFWEVNLALHVWQASLHRPHHHRELPQLLLHHTLLQVRQRVLRKVLPAEPKFQLQWGIPNSNRFNYSRETKLTFLHIKTFLHTNFQLFHHIIPISTKLPILVWTKHTLVLILWCSSRTKISITMRNIKFKPFQLREGNQTLLVLILQCSIPNHGGLEPNLA